MFELLKDSTYIRYWLAVVASFLGDAMARITLIYVAATLTDAPTALIALVIIAQLLPTGVLGVFAGPLTDRLPKRVLLVGSDLARVAIVLAMIPALHSTTLLLVLIFLEGLGKTFFETARIAAIPAIVGAHSIPSAVALFQSTNHTLNLVGPALGGVLIAIGSVPVVLVINAGTFVVSALLLGSMKVLKTVPVSDAPPQRYWAALREGLREVLRVPTLRFLFAFLVPMMIVLGLFTTNFNAQLLTVFGLPAAEYGLAHALFGGGAVLGALLGPMMVRRYPVRGLLLATVALFGVSLVVLAPTEWVRGQFGITAVLAWCLVSGLGSSLFQVPIANTVLRDLPEVLRGRGVGLLNSVMTTSMVIGVALGGLTATWLGVADSIVYAGVALLLCALAFAIPARRAPQLEATP
ncbi:MFS transporter [Actinosynnema sp. NPDC047251]|uniref:Permease, MFS-type n=1 Tax=Saccharothrix espanaensis (strain ATCC 51144 / DSM 44229 / JCM 9112 / NBRC 15066 / NRRL 15764) TaxID=1179773 RepID=K0JW73_SACES|nr:MFS transporter [Saccharothrix espanaensis]CCH32065.1 Permease, MFS-type [Saccharothrix espanaensis DSM 44229]